MQAPVASFFEWQERYATDEACAAELADLRWPDGFAAHSVDTTTVGIAARVGIMNVLAATTKPPSPPGPSSTAAMCH